MTPNDWIQLILYFVVLGLLAKPLGWYMARVYQGEPCCGMDRVFGWLERGIYRVARVDPQEEMGWRKYTVAVLLFNAVGFLAVYGLLRMQGYLPLNPQNFPPVAPDLAFNTAASFTTNTNWQAYTGESTMSYLTQMAGLAWHNFMSAAVGIGIALALARGITYRLQAGAAKTLGNFWVDLVRATVYVLIPISIPVALLLVSQGVIQNFSSYVDITTLEGVKQTLAMGPVASQEIIKELGTNGGGFFNANSAHPFESATPLTNFIEMLLIFSIPAAMTYTYGRMARDQKQGWVLFAAMALIFVVGVWVAYSSEAQGNPLMRGMAVDQGAGNWEGKEARFGIANSALFATVTTATSCGAVNSMHDSFTALGGLVPMVNIMLGEIIFGGVGSGLYGMLIFVVLSVFIAGLMVGRTPEYLGKKIESREIKLSMLYVLIFPLLILYYAGWSLVAPYGVSSLNNAGPHGLSEILYAYSSAAGNNGSAFAGLNANTLWFNVSLGLTMLAGRFLMIIPAMAVAGSLVGKKAVPESLGTFPTNGSLFVVLLVGVIIIVGALTFFPALALGPIVEHFLAQAGKVY